MTWCDKLASTPAVGYQFEQHFASADRIIDSLSPIIDQWYDNGKPTFQVAKHESFHVELHHDSGFIYSVAETKASITFQHRLKLRNTSAGPPVAELISSPLQFTTLIDKALVELVKVTQLLPGSKNRHINRVGIVTSTNASRDDLPPGITKMLNYFGRPWDAGLHAFNINVTAKLREDDNFLDRCIHNIVKNENDDDELITFRFDWQRELKKPINVIEEDMHKLNSSSQKAAMSYFEELGVGNVFDERIIRER